MFRRTFTGVAVLGLALGAMTGTAGAHEHQLETPNGKTVSIPCEPFHGTTPGESQHSANWDADRGLHPIHWGLHMSPSSQERAVTVSVSSSTC